MYWPSNTPNTKLIPPIVPDWGHFLLASRYWSLGWFFNHFSIKLKFIPLKLGSIVYLNKKSFFYFFLHLLDFFRKLWLNSFVHKPVILLPKHQIQIKNTNTNHLFTKCSLFYFLINSTSIHSIFFATMAFYTMLFFNFMTAIFWNLVAFLQLFDITFKECDICR